MKGKWLNLKRFSDYLYDSSIYIKDRTFVLFTICEMLALLVNSLIGVLLGELLGQLAQVGHSLVKRVTVVSDCTGRVSGDLQLALIERNSVGEGWHLGQCDVGDLLRHNSVRN